MTQDALASVAGIANRYVVQLERGEAGNPSLRLIAALSHALSVDPVELFRDAPPPELRRRGRPRKATTGGP